MILSNLTHSMELDKNERRKTNVHITHINQKPYIQSSLGSAQ
jgi:hypothetical protein